MPLGCYRLRLYVFMVSMVLNLLALALQVLEVLVLLGGCRVMVFVFCFFDFN